MGLFSFFKKKDKEVEKVGGMEDFMTLIRVYYQAVLASNLGITNLSMLADMATFKRTLKIPTQNNKLGIAERSRCKKMLEQLYGMNEDFFREIDASIKKNCKNLNSVQPYLFAFQGFNNDLMMLVSNLLSWKLRIPSIFNGLLRGLTEKTINDILTKNSWKDQATFQTVYAVRQYKEKLGYSEKWIVDYVYKIISLAKKEPRKQAEDMDKK
ncbi:MAG: hypothetical protein IKV23_00480 [Bacteroidaceae bacterium]|nr:hypothetical protein [Bacteroidaceae bacterium]